MNKEQARTALTIVGATVSKGVLMIDDQAYNPILKCWCRPDVVVDWLLRHDVWIDFSLDTLADYLVRSWQVGGGILPHPTRSTT